MATGLPFYVQTERKKIRVVLYRRKTTAPFYFRFWWKGKQHNLSTGHMTEPAARASVRAEIERIVNANPSTETLANLIDAYLLERWPLKVRVNNLGFSGVKSRLKIFKATGPREFAVLPRREASTAIQKYLVSRSDKAPYTVRTEQQALSRFCSWLIKSGLSHWESNPAQAIFIDLPATESKTKDALTDKEVAALLKAVKGHPIEAVVLVCLGSGSRPAEAVRLRWEDIDFEKGTLKLFGKRRERIVPMSKWLREQLLPLKSVGQLWPGNYFAAFDSFGYLRKQKKLPMHVSLQACRRTACRKAAEKISVFEYSEFFGHSLEVAKRHYIGWGMSVDRRAVDDALRY